MKKKKYKKALIYKIKIMEKFFPYLIKNILKMMKVRYNLKKWLDLASLAILVYKEPILNSQNMQYKII
jgi:hypothetical protein